MSFQYNMSRSNLIVRSQLTRSRSESAGQFDPVDTLPQPDDFLSDSNQSLGPQTLSPIPSVHARRSTEPGAGALRTRLSRLSELREDRPGDRDGDGDTEHEVPRTTAQVEQEDREDTGNRQTESRQRRDGMRNRVSYAGDMGSSEPFEDSSERLPPRGRFGGSLAPPSYRTAPSASGTSRRSYLAK